jgi:tape measure domain-containing protein
MSFGPQMTLADLMVRLNLDTSNFERGARRAEQSARGFRRVLQDTLSGATMGAGMAVANAALSVLVQAFNAAQDAVIGFNSTLEQADLAFGKMLKSGEAARSFLADLKRFAAQTPFEFPELLTASRRLLAFKFQAGQIIPLMTAIGDVAAASGNAGAEGIGRLTTALGQMQAKGRVQQEELLQLQEAGVATSEILAIVARDVGMTMDEVEEALSKGRISSDAFIKAFMEWSQANVGGMMAEQAKTFQGAMSTISDSLRDAAATAFRALFVRLSEAAQRFAQFVQSAEFGEWVQKTALYVEFVIRALAVLANAFQRTMVAIATIVVTAGAVILKGMALLNPFVRHSPSLVESVEEGFGRRIPAAIAGMAEQVREKLAIAGRAVAAFKAMASGGLARAEGLRESETVGQVARLGPGATGAYVEARNAMRDLESQAESLGGEIREGEAALREMERALRPLQDAFDAASRRVQGYRNTIAEAQEAMRRLVSEGKLPGEEHHENQLADNRRRQAETELRMLELKAKGSPTATDEREYQRLQKQLEGLRTEEQRLRLQGELTFGEQRRKLAQAAGEHKEVSARDRLAGILKAKEALQQAQQALPAAEAEMKGAGEALELAKGKIELQRTALQDLKDEYAEITRELQAQRAAMDQMLAEARELDQAAKAGAGGAGKGDIGKGLTFGAGTAPPWAKKADDWATENNALRSLATELEETLKTLEKNLDTGVGKIEAFATGFQKQFGIEGGLPGALAAFRQGWDDNFGPMMEKLGEFGTWLSENTPAAMQGFQRGWETYLRPTFEAIREGAKTVGVDVNTGLVQLFSLWLPLSLGNWQRSWAVAEAVFKGMGPLFDPHGPMKPLYDFEVFWRVTLPVAVNGFLGNTLDKLLEGLGSLLEKLRPIGEVLGAIKKGFESIKPPDWMGGGNAAPGMDGGNGRGSGGGRRQMYATGGSFVVGGHGGLDSQLVSFMATPGERVTITPPGNGGGALALTGPLVGSISIQGREDVTALLRALEGMLMQALEQAGGSGTRFPLGMERRM